MSKELTKREVEHFRRELLRILGRATDTTGRIEDEVIAVGGALEVQGDEGAEQEFEEVDLDALEVEEATAEAAAEALERIADGTYGRCTECGAWIVKGRLEAAPYTPFCLRCQIAEEEGEPAS